MVTTRFAPSPTGYLHLGHAFSAALNHAIAAERDGRFVLRIEDIDDTRCRPEFETAIVEDLAWLGLDHDPAVLRQSDRLPIYTARLDGLAARGLVYRCFRSRKEVADALSAPHGHEGKAFTAKPLPAAEERRFLEDGRPFAWRLSMAAAKAELGPAFDSLEVTEENPAGGSSTRAARPEIHGDVVLGRKDIGTSYHLASVVDDAETGVDLVCRGEDLTEAADLHVLLYALLGEAPPLYRHHRLLTDETGRRLAKRDRAATIRALREAGGTPAGVMARLLPLS